MTCFWNEDELRPNPSWFLYKLRAMNRARGLGQMTQAEERDDFTFWQGIAWHWAKP